MIARSFPAASVLVQAEAGPGLHQAPVGGGLPERGAAVAGRVAGVLDGVAAAGRVGPGVQRRLDERRIGGADRVVERLAAVAVAGLGVRPGLEQGPPPLRPTGLLSAA